MVPFDANLFSLGAKLLRVVGTSNVLESLEQWTKDKEVVVPLSPGNRNRMVRLDAPLWLETAADLFFQKLLSDEDIRTYFIDLENYRYDGVIM
jgi:hypothetical protein